MSETGTAATSSNYTGRLEVGSGPTDRRRWPDTFKPRIVQESFAHSAGVSAVARRHGITPQQLTGWRRAARDGLLPLDGDQMDTARDTPSFVPLEVTAPAAWETERGAAEQAVEIVADRVTVRLPANADAMRIVSGATPPHGAPAPSVRSLFARQRAGAADEPSCAR